MNPGNFYLVVSGIREMFLVESGILGFGIRNPAQLMGHKHDTCNPESVESGIPGLESRIQDCPAWIQSMQIEEGAIAIKHTPRSA